MVLKVLPKFPPTLVLVHGWLFPGYQHLPMESNNGIQDRYGYLGLAKTYILRGTPRTYVIKTRAVTDN